jgi:hypothetical protein
VWPIKSFPSSDPILFSSIAFFHSKRQHFAMADETIQRVEGIAPTADELIVDIAGAARPQQARDHIQSQWPPASLGFVPDSGTKPLEVPGLENVRSCTPFVIISLMD